MEGSVAYDDSRVFSKKGRTPNRVSDALDSLWAPNSSPSFHGCATMVNFEDEENNTETPFFNTNLENSNEDLDECFNHRSKKRRLMPDQVQFLEKSFELDNKLEPERKVQLAKELGLQPRQVAIWFQNRRARYKSKVLEKEYNSLKSSYDKLKADYDTLYKENEAMKNEVYLLTEKLLNGKPKQEPNDDPISPLDLLPKMPIFSPDAASNVDVFDSSDSHHSVSLEAADYSSHVFEAEASDFSQEEDDSLSRSFVQPFPKIEGECFDDLQPNSCNLGFPVQHQGTWLWQY